MEWHTLISSYNRIVANAHTEYEETPLNFNLGVGSSPCAANAAENINSNMVSAICPQVMYNLKGEQHSDDNNGVGLTSFASFAGIDLQSFL